MVMMNMNEGRLIVHRILPRHGEAFECYSVRFEDGEGERLKRWLLKRRDLLKKALEKKDPSILPRFYDPFNSNHFWKCRFCQYKAECEAIEKCVSESVQPVEKRDD